MKAELSRRELRLQVACAMAAGAAAARQGIPISNCPYGECKGAQDEFHSDVRISSWVLGYIEEIVRCDMDAQFRRGTQMWDEHGIGVPSPTNCRVKQALIDGFTHAVVQMDLVESGRVQ